MIDGIFPVPIGRYIFERHFYYDELNFINSLKKKDNFGNSISEDKSVLDLPEFKEIRNSLEGCLTDFFQTVYNPKNKTNIYITQSWINWSTKGQYHHQHAHPNSFVSGVLYIEANKDTDKIIFHKNNYRQLEIIPKDRHILNSDTWDYSVGSGDIMLFSSDLVHSVPEIDTDQTRISLAFNSFIEGELGVPEGPTKLILKK